MSFRRARTGGMIVVTADGIRQNVPPGTCWIGPRGAAATGVVVQWSEYGVHYSGRISAEDLAACLRGCLLQYA